MSEHYTQSTESDLKYCPRCQRRTEHAVSAGRIGRCREHAAPRFTQKQQRLADKRAEALREPNLPGIE